jgi:hypothetical protein
MNSLEDQIDRLLHAAGMASATEASATHAPAVPPLGLEARVLAAWRESRAPGFWSTPLLLRGLLLSCLVMGLCLWPALNQTQKSTPEADTLQLADSTLQIDNL